MVFTQHARSIAKLAGTSAFIALMVFSGLAQAEYQLNFQEPVTQIARDIFGLHMLIFWICVGIFVAVFGVMFYSIFKHRKSKSFTASTFSHSTSVEIAWTIVPFIILVAMAIPATKVLINMEDTTKSDMTIKITGYQWKWGYEYLDSDISFFSTLTTPREQIDQFDTETAQPQGDEYLLEVDNVVVVPSGRKVRALITANDVIHAWWIPAFGVKKDAVPGYINELWFNVDPGKEGIYKGQCAELCGKDHAFMPIVVKVVTAEEFDGWVAAGGQFLDTAPLADVKAASVDVDVDEVEVEVEVEAAAEPETEVVHDREPINSVIEAIIPAAEANEDESKEWTKEELMAKGEKVSAQCMACHGADGKGIPGAFPAISGSAVVTGPVDAHIDTVMFGRAGTAMMAFAAQLNDEDIASVITYQRNSYGNSVGDVVQPSAIKAKRN